MISFNVITPELSTIVQIKQQHKMLMMEHYLKKRKQDAGIIKNSLRLWKKGQRAVSEKKHPLSG